MKLLLLLVALPLLAKQTCDLPMPNPSAYGYKVTAVTDSLGQHWVYLTIHLQYGEQELYRKLDQFPGDQMSKAVKEGEDWRKCVQKNIKTLPAKSLPRASY